MGAEVSGFDPFAGGEVAASVDSTEAQREIWLAIQIGGEEASLAYNESISLVMERLLDGKRLRRALTGLIQRHEALRATFNSDGTTLLIAAEPVLQIEEVDLQGLAAEEADLRCREIRTAEVSRLFDLGSGPLIRFQRLLLPASREELVITAHHLVCDGWSFGVLVTELEALYAGSELPPAPRFTDHAEQARRALFGPAADATEVYWCEALGESPAVLDLPTDRSRSAAMKPVEGVPTRDLGATRLDRVLAPELVVGLDQLAKQRGVGMPALLLTAFATFLRRLSGQDDFAIGLPAAAQAHTGAYGLVGHCVQMLPIRVRCLEGETVPSLAKAVRTSILDGFEHQALAFGSLLQRLRLERDPSRVPLIPVMFNVDQEFKVPAIGGGATRLVSNPRVAENFELFLNVTPERGAMVLEATYRTGLFDDATVAAWLEGFEALLHGLVADPDGASGRLPCVSGEQRQRQVIDWNRTAREFAALTPLARIRAQAEVHPERIAVQGSGRCLSYGELLRYAQNVAVALSNAGVGPGDRVGVAHGRNPAILPALLGIWMVGAAYVPLDPDYPEDRLRYVLDDAGVQVVVSDSATPPGFLSGQTHLGPGQLTAPGVLDEPVHAARTARAYVIHTSGSTGKPKGVAVSLGAVDNFLMAMAERPGMGPDDVLVAVTPLSFDISVLELFLPLVVGAQLVIADRDEVQDPSRLAALLSRSEATVLQATPSGWRALLDSGWSGTPGLKALCGGEALPQDLAGQLVSAVGSLWNMYGPTEATVWSTVSEVTDGDAPVVLGEPIANTTAHVLDAGLALLPPGSAAGELLLGGDGLAEGYLGLGDLTAERFVPDPFSDKAGARLYRTGDRVRRDAGGRLHFMGRMDFQVKVRGFRIELGEVETVLQSHDAVRVAVASVHCFGPGDDRLVAWVVAEPGTAVEPDVLWGYLQERVPPQAIPQHILPVDELPMTANGKVDRNALPLPDSTPGAAQGRTPEGATELALAAIWQELLRLDCISADADFFMLGGHSLLAARLFARIAERWAVKLPLQAVFQAPTVATLAQMVDAALYAGRTLSGDARDDLDMEEIEL